MLLALLIACRVAEVVDYCVDEPEACAGCMSDEDCLYAGNACTEAVYCTQSGAGPSVIQIGCSEAIEYAWPEPDTCGCVEGVCRSTP
ncbi:MAG: hypothetical protein Q8P18_29980 [Pseudomonadota bacterium]|nr:hypothetical protein [Pseudomonadota bacterium]